MVQIRTGCHDGSRRGALTARLGMMTVAAGLLAGVPRLGAQQVGAATMEMVAMADPAGPGATSSSLPDAPLPNASAPDAVLPDATLPQTGKAAPRSRAVQREASPFQKFIAPGQTAPELTTFDKVVIGFKDSATPFSALGWVTSATYEQITNGPPNYGQDGKGYLQRVGAAAARGTSEGVFTAAVFAPLFHTDPRYYQLGNRLSTFHRIAYAASRTLITRTDSGRETLNAPLLLGYLGGTSLTQAYYPPGNRGIGALSRTYAESLLGASLSFTVSEFLSDALAAVHLQVPRF